MRKLTPEQNAELERLYAETVALIDWCTTYQDFSYGPAVKEALEKARAGRRLPAMRSLAREFRGFLTVLPPALQADVIEAIRLESGVSLAPSNLLDALTAEEIIKRGSIQNDDEYDLLRQYLEGVANGAQSSVSQAALEQLLDSYGRNGSSAS